MLRRLLPVAVFAALATSASSQERWEEYWACEANVLANVEQAEPSVWDGAKLIAEALCMFAATDLANDMVNSRDYLQEQPPGDAFSSALSVIRRETAIKLYRQRELRLGLGRN
ncbi:hypothetical protein [Rhodosalinus sp. K401]|uniref:hypothetical protein n=1 Tax=Rhodosalinus sp. K401 TaxID=3239195 RepID=UPI0035233D53